MNDYEFHTREVDGRQVVGVLFVAGSGRFYEFQNPDDHDDYARFVDPRSGKVMTWTSRVDRTKKRVLGGQVFGLIGADKWAEFREQYVNAPADKEEAWRSEWERIHTESLEELATG